MAKFLNFYYNIIKNKMSHKNNQNRQKNNRNWDKMTRHDRSHQPIEGLKEMKHKPNDTLKAPFLMPNAPTQVCSKKIMGMKFM